MIMMMMRIALMMLIGLISDLTSPPMIEQEGYEISQKLFLIMVLQILLSNIENLNHHTPGMFTLILNLKTLL